jgi:N-acylneuraminate cytidylyltransferase
VLAVVPARGGSKSIPRKNLRRFAGHPLLAYSIAAGRQAASVARVIVSTDDEEIARVARGYGADVPFLRPGELAGDGTTDLPVFQHVLHELERQEGYRPDIVVQLRPTSPVRPRDCVDRAVALLRQHPEADSVRGVVPSGQNPYKMWRLTEGEGMKPLLPEIPEAYNLPRQALPATYWQTGHVDAIRASTIADGSMSGVIIWPLLLDPIYSVDIDTPGDWLRAEWLVEQTGIDMVRPGPARRPLPATVRLVVLDFDGVLTDDRVWVDGDGTESVAADRSDGMGLARLKAAGIEAIVISSEVNPVVAARCRKLGLAWEQGVTDKAAALQAALSTRGVAPAEAIYLGNDVNDLPCFPLVACAVAVADAAPEVLQAADLILSRPGGRGAVRELCELLIRRKEAQKDHDA